MDRTACTEPQCLYKGALYLYLYPYYPYGPYRASVPVQRCTLPLPIPLFPVWAVQPVQSLSACTTVHFTFTYTSTPPMGRTACTEPQCLYYGALYLYLYLYSPYGPYGLYRASVPVQRCTLPFFYSMFLFAGPFRLRKITTDPHIFAHVNIQVQCPTEVSKLNMYVSKPILDRYYVIPNSTIHNNALHYFIWKGLWAASWVQECSQLGILTVIQNKHTAN